MIDQSILQARFPHPLHEVHPSCNLLDFLAAWLPDQNSLLQARLAQLQADRDRLDSQATTAEKDYAAASSELEKTRLNLKVKLEEQQNQFKAIEEEQYSDWEKRVIYTHLPAWLSLVIKA